MVDTLRDIGPGTIVIAGDVHFKIYKIDAKPTVRTYRKLRCLNPRQFFFTESNFRANDEQEITSFKALSMSVKTVPTTWRGHASSSDCKYAIVALFVSGDQEAYQEWLQCEYRAIVDVSHAMVATDPNLPKPIGNLKGFSKMDLICAVIMTHGPSTRDDILRRVAAMEGKPWVITSNHDYFNKNRQGAIEGHGKVERGRKTFRCTVEGLRRGSAVIDRLGMETILGLK